LGNLIVGYNEFRGVGDDRSGSHNIVVGQQHNYSSIGGLVAGFGNTISGPYASVSGGSINTATGPAASVGGGTRNLASGAFSWVSGSQNTASGAACSVSGGSGNLASGNFASLWHEDQNHCSGQGQPPIPRRR
jgi:hypothetical protein